MQDALSPKQLEFIHNSHAKWNLASGAVRSGKTVGTLFAFMLRAYLCPDSQIWMVGRSSETIFDNVIRLIIEPPARDKPDPFAIFRPFCSWSPGKRELKFYDKTIGTLGAQNEGAIGAIQGKTFSLVYCDEMTLYPESIIDMIDTRLSNPHSMGYASMNPSHPKHKCKQWIDKAESGDKNYYALQFTLDDNPYVDQDYKLRIFNSLSGVFRKRNYYGVWCLAEGAIFDFFDYDIYTRDRARRTAEYYICGIDYGTSNAFACVLIGVNTGRQEQIGKYMFVEDEYYWDYKKTGRQKTNSEYVDDVYKFIEPYGVKSIYIDPSAASFKLELQRRGLHPVDADNDVDNGILIMIDQMKKGNLDVLRKCKNLIREIESYVWDQKASEKGYDQPLKQDDHAIDALRYAVATHKVSNFDMTEHNKKQKEWFKGRYDTGPKKPWL